MAFTGATTGSYEGTLTTRIDGATISTYLLSLIAVALRVVCRNRSKAGMWWDDWTIVLALIPNTASFLLLMIDLRNTLGHHIEVVGIFSIEPFLKAFYSAQLLYVVDIAIIKISILLFYWRLFAVSSRRPIILMMTILGVWAISLILVMVFQCRPISSYWNRLILNSTCMDEKVLFTGGSAPNIATDFLIMAIPIPYVWRLQARLAQRLTLAAVFLVGGFVSIVSIIRLRVLLAQDLSNPDITYNLTEVVLWSAVEIDIGVVCACLPSLRPVLTFLRTGQLFPTPMNPSLGGGGSYQSPLQGRNSTPMGFRTPTNITSAPTSSSRTWLGSGSANYSMSTDATRDGNELLELHKQIRTPKRDAIGNSEVEGKSHANAETRPAISWEDRIEAMHRAEREEEGKEEEAEREASGTSGINVRTDWSVIYGPRRSSGD